VLIIDSNVFFDAEDPDSPAHEWAISTLRSNAGVMGINPIIYAELLQGQAPETLDSALGMMGVHRLDLPWASCAVAANAFKRFLTRSSVKGERRRTIPLPDFFIGAHAEVTGFPVATSDKSRFKTYFPNVRLIE
jgi:predicted nucleic acid-binding protein